MEGRHPRTAVLGPLVWSRPQAPGPQPVAPPTVHPWRKAALLPKPAFPWLKALPATSRLGARERG